jgi:hypothetical protein
VGNALNDAFMRQALKKILADPNHPLGFLVDREKRDWLGRAEDFDGPGVQAGHRVTKAYVKQSGEPEQLALQDAQYNQTAGQRGETQGAIFYNEAVEIGGIPVEKRTAEFYERQGAASHPGLPPGTVASAKPSLGWQMPLDVVTLGLYGNIKAFEEARADFVTRTAKGDPVKGGPGQRGFASVGGMVFSIVSIAGTIHILRELDSLKELGEVVGGAIAVEGTASLLSRLVKGGSGLVAVLSVVLTLPDDQGGPSEEELQEEKVDEFLAKYFSDQQIAAGGKELRTEVRTLLFETRPYDLSISDIGQLAMYAMKMLEAGNGLDLLGPILNAFRRGDSAEFIDILRGYSHPEHGDYFNWLVAELRESLGKDAADKLVQMLTDQADAEEAVESPELEQRDNWVELMPEDAVESPELEQRDNWVELMPEDAVESPDGDSTSPEDTETEEQESSEEDGPENEASEGQDDVMAPTGPTIDSSPELEHRDNWVELLPEDVDTDSVPKAEPFVPAPLIPDADDDTPTPQDDSEPMSATPQAKVSTDDPLIPDGDQEREGDQSDEAPYPTSQPDDDQTPVPEEVSIQPKEVEYEVDVPDEPPVPPQVLGGF